MNTEHRMPQRLLLASDLSWGCDRPLDRAKQLAGAWQASLTVLMVREGPGTPEEVASWLDKTAAVHPFELAARAELADEFAGTDLPATLQVVRGDVSDSILQAAAVLQDAVVVIGARRAESFPQALLGSTAARLAQEMDQPLLVVRQRTRGSYARILVANDFGDAARTALATALRLFPTQRITLIHVLEESAPGLAEASAAIVHTALRYSERFLDDCALPEGARARIDVVIGHGSVPDAIARHVEGARTQLVVLGVHRHSALARVFVGNISDELLRRLSCDTLLVRATESGADD